MPKDFRVYRNLLSVKAKKCIENWKILPLSNRSDELIDKYILHFDIIFCARDYTLSNS